MRTKLILLILPLLLFSCSCDNCNEQKDLQCNILCYEDTQDEDPYINYKLYGDRLYIIKNDMYNCCAKYITISATICNNNLYITEKQSSYQCKCLKNKIIEYSIDNVDDIHNIYINNELKIKIK